MTKESVNRGKQLRLAREYRGYSQSVLCKKLEGLSIVSISRYESGFNDLTDEDVSKIMNLLDFPISFLDRDHHSFDVEFLS